MTTADGSGLPSREQILEAGMPGTRSGIGTPPFGFRIDVPPGWKVLRSDDEHLRHDVERAATDTPGWSSMRPEQQMKVRTFLTGLAVQSKEAGNALVAADAGVSKDGGELLMGSLTLAWMRTLPLAADITLAELMAEGADEIKRFSGRHSVGILACSVSDTGAEAMAGYTGSTAYSIQAYVPTPGTAWMGVVTGTTPNQSMAGLMEAATRRMAQTLAVEREDPEPEG